MEDLVRNHLSQRAPFVKVAAKEVVNRNIEHQFVILEPSEKDDFIDEFLLDREGEFGLIFCRTKAGAIALGNALNKRGHDTAVLQGDLTQPERDKVMRAFRKKRVPTLIATDVAARGLDVADLAFVIHHRLPDNIEYYTHRSGRTARAGKGGLSLVLLEPKQRPHLGKFASDLHIHFGEYRLQK